MGSHPAQRTADTHRRFVARPEGIEPSVPKLLDVSLYQSMIAACMIDGRGHTLLPRVGGIPHNSTEAVTRSELV